MLKPKREETSEKITEVIIHGIQEKKGKEIVSLDLRNIAGAACDCFIICHADSTTQVRAIAESIEEEMYKSMKEDPWHKEGFENCEWILLDYINVVVHVFMTEKRDFYGVEDLWGDAKIKAYKSA